MKEFLSHAYENAICVFNHVYAWVLYLLAFISSFVGDEGVMYVHCILAAVGADVVCGIWKSTKQKKGFSPKKLFKKIPTLALYLLVLLLFHIVDVVIGEDTTICMKAIAVAIVIIEVWSVLGNLAIIFPKMALLSIVQKFLLTTLSEKVNMSEDEIKEAIESVKDPKNSKTNPFEKEEEENDCSAKESVNCVEKENIKDEDGEA